MSRASSATPSGPAAESTNERTTRRKNRVCHGRLPRHWPRHRAEAGRGRLRRGDRLPQQPRRSRGGLRGHPRVWAGGRWPSRPTSAIPKAWPRRFTAFRQQFDRVDIVVSNAAIGVLRPALELTLKHWRRCMETNALALNSLAQQAVPLMTPGRTDHRHFQPRRLRGPFRITPSSAPPRPPSNRWPAAWPRNSARAASASTSSAPAWWTPTR